MKTNLYVQQQPGSATTAAATAASPSQEYDYLYKIVIHGDRVGKSNILSRFITNEFFSETKCTIGIEFKNRQLQVDETIINLQIWDTAGQERYRAINSSMYRGAVASVLVYDITKGVTFRNIERWLTEVQENSAEDAPIFLVGNKSDLKHLREVEFSDAKEFAEKNGLGFIEVSALDGTNIEALFCHIAATLYLASQTKQSEEAFKGKFIQDLKAIVSELQADGNSLFTLYPDTKKQALAIFSDFTVNLHDTRENIQSRLDNIRKQYPNFMNVSYIKPFIEKYMVIPAATSVPMANQSSSGSSFFPFRVGQSSFDSTLNYSGTSTPVKSTLPKR